MPQAYIVRREGEPSLDQMHDIADVVINALHTAFDGRDLDATALAFTLIASGLGVLRDSGIDHVKERATDFIAEVDLRDIMPFSPQSH